MSQHEELIRRLFEATNHQDVEALRAMYADEFELNGQRTRFEAFAGAMPAFFKAFPDVQGAVDALVWQGDRMLARWTTTATHLGDYAGATASGRQVTWSGMSWYRIKGGRIVEMWQVADLLGLLQQIGALPEKFEASKRHRHAPQPPPQMIEFQIRPTPGKESGL